RISEWSSPVKYGKRSLENLICGGIDTGHFISAFKFLEYRCERMQDLLKHRLIRAFLFKYKIFQYKFST
ncbi:hypothetical protein, partial [Succinatimonas hippei]|uniref:hypothetical protein n=1 Tax=Succinatimonas hippei TaxID=626938 RepID=UPI0024911B6A